MTVPRRVTELISNRMIEELKSYGRRRNWTAFEHIKPYARKGQFGVKITEVPWLRYQNLGTKPFIPWNLEGKVVPFPNNEFRTAKGVGLPGYVMHDGERVWSEAKWLNRGITPKHFFEQTAQKAVDMYKEQALQNGGSVIRVKRIK